MVVDISDMLIFSLRVGGMKQLRSLRLHAHFTRIEHV